MRERYNHIKNVTIFCMLFIASCGGNDTPEEEIINDPKATTLIFPEANSECTEGTDISDTESTVVFKWNAAQYTDSYSLQLKDLKSGSGSIYTSDESKVSIRIKRDNPYSWSVSSKSNTSSKTATSVVWKFYNAGAGVVSHAPFPAEIVSPILGATVDSGTISLDWSGSDIDGDIDSYDVFFGETNPPVKIETDVEESILNTISVVSGKTYYWKIVTKDENGNSSSSDVFKFNVR